MSSQPPPSSGQPLFMVDHGFAKQSKSWTGNVRNRTLYGLSVAGEAASKTKKSRRRSRKPPTKPGSEVHDSSSDITSSSRQAGEDRRRESFDSMAPPRTPPSTKFPHRFVPSPDKEQVRRGSNLSGTPSALYGLNALDSIKGLECYMTYYLEVIGAGNYPMEMKLQVQDNPIRWSWFPLAFEDDLWLKNIIVTAAFHHADAAQMSAPQGACELMQSFIAQLNDRISNQNFSDGTIGSVSCLSTIEHASGNNEMAEVHLKGMAEMIKARGGLDAISRERRTKIMRADVVRSADLLKMPLLPRPQRPFSPLDQAAHLDGNDFSRSFELLLKSGITVNMSPICWNLRRTMQMIEAIWHSAQSMETMTYYEDIVCLNYDLLSFQPTTALERACRIALLTFAQPLYRYYPFSGRLAQPRSSSLYLAMQDLALESLDSSVRLWLYTVGSIGSQQTIERDWFRDLFAQALREQAKTGDCTWDAIQSQLKRIAWTEAVHGPLGKSVFLDVTLDPTRSKDLPSDFASGRS